MTSNVCGSCTDRSVTPASAPRTISTDAVPARRRRARADRCAERQRRADPLGVGERPSEPVAAVPVVGSRRLVAVLGYDSRPSRAASAQRPQLCVERSVAVLRRLRRVDDRGSHRSSGPSSRSRIPSRSGPRVENAAQRLRQPRVEFRATSATAAPVRATQPRSPEPTSSSGVDLHDRRDAVLLGQLLGHREPRPVEPADGVLQSPLEARLDVLAAEVEVTEIEHGLVRDERRHDDRPQEPGAVPAGPGDRRAVLRRDALQAPAVARDSQRISGGGASPQELIVASSSWSSMYAAIVCATVQRERSRPSSMIQFQGISPSSRSR